MYPSTRKLLAMQRYEGRSLYAALPLHMQRGCFRIRTHDQQVTKAQLYHCTRARPHYIEMNIDVKFIIIFYIIYYHKMKCKYKKKTEIKG